VGQFEGSGSSILTAARPTRTVEGLATAGGVTMIKSIWTIVPLGVLFSLNLPASSAAQTLGPDALVDGFLRAFNTHDAKAFGSLFTEDADWVSVAGIRVKGRAGIQAEHEKAFTTFFKSATLASTGTTVRLVRPDVAVVHFNWELTGQVDKEGKVAAPRRGVITIVATKEEDQWRITAGQNTNTFVPP